MKGMFTKEFSQKSGYNYLAVTIIESAILDWKKDKFDAIEWLRSDQSCLWCDYLDINKDWLRELLEKIELTQ